MTHSMSHSLSTPTRYFRRSVCRALDNDIMVHPMDVYSRLREANTVFRLFTYFAINNTLKIVARNKVAESTIAYDLLIQSKHVGSISKQSRHCLLCNPRPRDRLRTGLH